MSQVCPNCGAENYKVSRMCPMYEGESVCTGCCYKCEYYRADVFRCLYWMHHSPPDHSDEIQELSKQIEKKEGIMNYLYGIHRARAARQIEIEVYKLKAEKRRLMDESKK